MANIIVFAILAAVIIVAALASVFTTRIMRAVTALLFVLFAIAGIYFLLDYTFLGASEMSFRKAACRSQASSLSLQKSHAAELGVLPAPGRASGKYTGNFSLSFSQRPADMASASVSLR